MRNSFSIIIFKKAIFSVLSFLFIFCMNSYGQNQKIADSLEAIYALGNYTKQDRLKILDDLALNHTNPEKKLAYSEELIELAQELDSINYVWSGFMRKGNALRNKGDHMNALESHFRAERIAHKEKSDLKLGQVYIAIADVYSVMGNHNNAENYYNRAIELLRKSDDAGSLATSLLNAGDEFFNNKKYDVALQYFEESGRILRT